VSGMPRVGTRFMFYAPVKGRVADLYGLRQLGRDWEGEVVRTYDTWADEPGIELMRRDTGGLWHIPYHWWATLSHPGRQSLDHIVVFNTPERA
jgi:hypothetical protein